MKHEEEKAAGVIEDNKSELANSVFTGQYSEEESARSFQEALLQWRKERRDGKGNFVTTDLLWTPMEPGELIEWLVVVRHAHTLFIIFLN